MHAQLEEYALYISPTIICFCRGMGEFIRKSSPSPHPLMRKHGRKAPKGNVISFFTQPESKVRMVEGSKVPVNTGPSTREKRAILVGGPFANSRLYSRILLI